MTITQTRHLRFRRRQISRWRRRWSKTNGVIGFFLLLFFPPRYELAVAYLSIRFTHSSTLYNGIAACATLVYIYVGGMPMCVPHSIAPPVAHYNNVSLCLLFVIPNITGSLRLCIKPGPPACQSGCANHYTARASYWSLKCRNNWSGLAFYISAEFYSEIAQHSYYCRRIQRNVHGIYHSLISFQFIKLSTLAYENRSLASF